MNALLKKMQYKGDEEILILNSPDEFKRNLHEISSSAKVLSRNPKNQKEYGFILIFVKNCAEIIIHSKLAQNNLIKDGVLWFAYPKKSSKKYSTDVNRDLGWQPLGDLGFEAVRSVAVDEDWSALRFRHIDYIKNLTRDNSSVMSKKLKLK